MPQSERVHPRPLLARHSWIDLDGEWSFAYDEHEQGLQEGWMKRQDVFTQTISIPSLPGSAASGIPGEQAGAVIWYRRAFHIAEEEQGRHVVLHCGAIYERADIWVNGQFVVSHQGGSTPFSQDITSALLPNDEQVVVIRARIATSERPSVSSGQRPVGIWQPVWIEIVAATRIERLRWTPELDRGLLAMVLQLRRQDEKPLRVQVQLKIGERVLVDDSYVVRHAEIQRKLAFDGADILRRNQLLWSPRSPNLIDATITLYEGESVIDEVYSYIGLRNVRVEGNHFILNGRPFYLRMISLHNNWPVTQQVLPDDDAVRRELELVKAMGFNGVRVRQKIEDPRFLYWCDQLGLLVWEEMVESPPFSPASMAQRTREWIEVLERDYNHPCVISWIPVSEYGDGRSDPAQEHAVQGLYSLSRALDSTRPTIAIGRREQLASDIRLLRAADLEQAEAVQDQPDETGAVERSLQEGQRSEQNVILSTPQSSKRPILVVEIDGRSIAKEGDAFLREYERLLMHVLENPQVDGFCYLQLADSEQEEMGLLTAAREAKFDLQALYEITKRVSTALPGDAISLAQGVQGVSPVGGANVEAPYVV